MEKRGQVSLNNLTPDDSLIDKLARKKRIRKLDMFLIFSIIIVIIIIAVIFYNYYLIYEKTIKAGGNIEQVIMIEDGKTAYIKISAGANFVNITSINFIFKDKDNEYKYETTEGINNIEIPYETHWWNFFIKPKFLGSYDYVITHDKLGIANFNSIKEVSVVFNYITSEGTEVETSLVHTISATTNRTTIASGASSGSSGSSGTITTSGCTPSLTCSNYTQQCGIDLSDGCNDILDCSNNCDSTQNCIDGTCIDNDCIPSLSCEDYSGQCGILFNGCSNDLDCSNNCDSTQSCVDNSCIANINCRLDNDCLYLNSICSTGFCNMENNICERQYSSSSTICKTVLGECDSADYCTGDSPDCIDLKKPDRNPCSSLGTLSPFLSFFKLFGIELGLGSTGMCMGGYCNFVQEGDTYYFNASDGTPLATYDSNWVSPDDNRSVSNLKIYNNQVVNINVSKPGGAMYLGSTSDVAQIVFKAMNYAAVDKKVCVRMGQDIGNSTVKIGYCAWFSSPLQGYFTKVQVNKNGGDILGNFRDGVYFPINSDHTIRITATGTNPVTVKVYVDGIKVGVLTDSSRPLPPGGHPGFFMSSSGNFNLTAVDDWSHNPFPITYNLLTSATNGNIIKNPDKLIYNENEQVTIIANPNPGYVFSGWSGDITSTENQLTFFMNTHKTIIANFVPRDTQTFALNTNSINGAIIKSLDSTSYNSGNWVTLNAIPNSGYVFSGWSGDLSGTTNPLSLKMTSNKNVIANFISSIGYTLTTTASGGIITKNPNKATYTEGETVTLNATPAAGYSFIGWSGDIKGLVNPIEIKMTGNKKISANFAQGAGTGISITATAGSHGTISPSGILRPIKGSHQTFTFTPDPGYKVANVIVNGITFGPQSSYTFYNFGIGKNYLTLPIPDQTIYVNFESTSVQYPGRLEVINSQNSIPGTLVDLTKEGIGDWIKWNGPDCSSYNHKATGESRISTCSVIGDTGTIQATGRKMAFSDGTPVFSSAGSTTYIKAPPGDGNGFSFNVPADTTSRTLYFYGTSSGTGLIKLSLSDGSAAEFIDSTYPNSAVMYGIVFRASKPGQNLTVKWINTGAGQVGLNGATLIDYPGPITFTTLSLPSGAQYQPYTGIPLSAWGGYPPYSWKVTDQKASVPEGTKIDSETGIITGPIMGGQGIYRIQPKVTDSVLQTGMELYYITISIVGNNTLGGCKLFPDNSIYHHRVDSLPVDTSVLGQLKQSYKDTKIFPLFGTNAIMGAIPFIRVPWNQPLVNMTWKQNWKADPGPYPFPPYAPIEGTYNYMQKSDSHVAVLQTAGNGQPCKLYETGFSKINFTDNTWNSNVGVLWDLNSNALRDPGFTSGDAAGLPIMPLTLTYDEVATNSINHPIRFTMDLTLNYYVWPGRHIAGKGYCNDSQGNRINTEASAYAGGLSQKNPPAVCSIQVPPMGEIFRLKADVDTSICDGSPQAKTILTAMKQYGIIVSDNGMTGAIIGTPDSRWNDSDIKCLTKFTLGQFEAVDVSSLIVDNNSASTGEAVRYTITSSAGSGGKIYPNASIKVDQGLNQYFRITPKPNYKIDKITVDGVSVPNAEIYTFKDVRQNHAISATFKLGY